MVSPIQRTVASGSTDTFPVSFPYLDKSHVKVRLDGVLQSPSQIEWPTSGSIRILAGNPAAGTVVERRRETPTGPIVTFVPGNLDTDDLNTAGRQALYVAEEAAARSQDDATSAAAALLNVRQMWLGSFANDAAADAYATSEGITKLDGTTRYRNTTTGSVMLWTGSVWSSVGSGDVVGPAAAATNRVALFDGSTGKLLKDSGILISALAALASPAFSGTPTVPTAVAGTNTTQIASTAFVKTAIDNLISAAPGALDTLNELAAALGNDPNFATTVTNSLAGKQPLLTGVGAVELGANLSGDRFAYIDIHAADGADFNARLIRHPGTNGDLQLTQAGAGAIDLAGGGNLTRNGQIIWHAGNDGTGSGLDGDLLDGRHASYFVGLTNYAVNVLDYGAVGNGVADDYAAFVAARAAGNRIVVPGGRTYYLSADPNGGDGGTKNLHWDIDPTSTFSGPGADGFDDFLYGRTNWGHKAIGDYRFFYMPTQNTPSNGGISPVMYEMVASNANEARQSATLYVGAVGYSPHAAANVWAVNFLVAAEAGAAGIYQVAEIDANTNSASALVKGIAISGAGTANAYVGLEIHRAQMAWELGVSIYKSNIAVKIAPQPTGAGIVVKSLTAEPALAGGTVFSARQQANNADMFFLQRETDTLPTGHFFRFVNAANSDNLALMDIVGNLTIRGIFHAAGGYFGANGANPALNIDTDLGTTAAGDPAVYIRGSRNSERFIAHSYNSVGGTSGATVQLVSGRGTAVAPQPLQSGDRLGAYTGGGQFGTGLTDFARGNAILEFIALENFASGNRGTGLLVKLTPAGTSSLVTVARLQPGGSTFYQTANSADTFLFQRFTDTTPTGYIMRVVNAANSTNLAWIDVLGNANFAGFLDVGASIYFKPAASISPNDNGQVVFEFTNNTTLTVRAKGSDGTVRSGTVTLA